MTGKEAFKSTRIQRPDEEDGSGEKQISRGLQVGEGVKVHCPSLPHPCVTAPSLIHPPDVSANAKHLSTSPPLLNPERFRGLDINIFLNSSSHTPAPTQRLQICLVTNALVVSSENKPNPRLEWDLMLQICSATF